jgi:hypothetical protein
VSASCPTCVSGGTCGRARARAQGGGVCVSASCPTWVSGGAGAGAGFWGAGGIYVSASCPEWVSGGAWHSCLLQGGPCSPSDCRRQHPTRQRYYPPHILLRRARPAGMTLNVLFLSWLYAYYCYDYRWGLLGIRLPDRLAFVERRWAFFAGAVAAARGGAPFASTSCWASCMTGLLHALHAGTAARWPVASPQPAAHFDPGEAAASPRLPCPDPCPPPPLVCPGLGAGFGFPCVATTVFLPFYVGAGLCNLLFPLFILVAASSDPAAQHGGCGGVWAAPGGGGAVGGGLRRAAWRASVELAGGGGAVAGEGAGGASTKAQHPLQLPRRPTMIA